MKKFILGAVVIVMALAACGGKKNAESIVGSWVMPIEGQPGQVQGIKMDAGGEASSINMATLVYKSWEQKGDDLFLAVKSIGNGMEIEGIDTLKIEKLTADSLILSSNYGYTLRYVRQK
ncbi:lipocalin family protein [Bacteroides sp.]|uniref:lipocalin family protein n=1 Tax=Bacteroides sp. TaxID=29523 RepID=UPI00261B6DC3|nr:lipocalin family protein [Bacteroides sp.]